MRIAAGIAWVAGALVLPTASFAVPARVALFRPADDSGLVRELTARTAGEVVAAGFSVDLQDLSVEAPPADGVAVASIVISAVGSDLGDGQIDITIDRQLIYQAIIRRNQIAAADGGRVLAAAAVRAVAVLQTSLGERGSHQSAPPAKSAMIAPRTPPSPSSQSPETSSPSRPSETSWLGVQSRPRAGPARLGLGVAVSVLQSLDGIDPTVAPTARISYRATPMVSGGLRLTGLGTSASATAPAGSAQITQDLALADVSLALRPAGRLHPLLRAGAGVYHMGLQGSGTSPFVGRTDRLWGAAAAIGAGVVIDLGARLSLVIESDTLWVWPQPAVQIESVGAGRAGRPSLTYTLGLMVWL